MVRYGQAVVGPPGSGKTTYCHGAAAYLHAMGRPVAIVNVDPANDRLPYKPDVDVTDLVNLTVSLPSLEGTGSPGLDSESPSGPWGARSSFAASIKL